MPEGEWESSRNCKGVKGDVGTSLGKCICRVPNETRGFPSVLPRLPIRAWVFKLCTEITYSNSKVYTYFTSWKLKIVLITLCYVELHAVNNYRSSTPELPSQSFKICIFHRFFPTVGLLLTTTIVNRSWGWWFLVLTWDCQLCFWQQLWWWIWSLSHSRRSHIGNIALSGRGCQERSWECRTSSTPMRRSCHWGCDPTCRHCGSLKRHKRKF